MSIWGADYMRIMLVSEGKSSWRITGAVPDHSSLLLTGLPNSELLYSQVEEDQPWERGRLAHSICSFVHSLVRLLSFRRETVLE
jgi:hypothetical protein